MGNKESIIFQWCEIYTWCTPKHKNDHCVGTATKTMTNKNNSERQPQRQRRTTTPLSTLSGLHALPFGGQATWEIERLVPKTGFWGCSSDNTQGQQHEQQQQQQQQQQRGSTIEVHPKKFRGSSPQELHTLPETRLQ